MKFSNSFKRIVNTACITFSAVAVFYSVAMYFTYMSLSDTVNLDAYRLMMFFPFAILFALGNEILFSMPIPKWGRILIHYPIIVAGFYLFVYAPAVQGVPVSESNLLVIIVLLSAIYAIVMAVGALIRRLIYRKEKKAQEIKANQSYSPLFK